MVSHRTTPIPQTTVLKMRRPQDELPVLVQTVKEDLEELKSFFNISFSPSRASRIEGYLRDQLEYMSRLPFDDLDRPAQIDAILLKNYLHGSLSQLNADKAKDDQVLELVGSFARPIISLCEARQHVQNVSWQDTAAQIADISAKLVQLKSSWSSSEKKPGVNKFVAYRAAYKLTELEAKFAEWHKFYFGYDPLFNWWLTEPYKSVKSGLEAIIPIIRKDLAGIDPDEEEPIVGEPIGRDGILADLDLEKIAYTPEELIDIGEQEYVWCENEAKKAAEEMGYGSDWRRALEHVKNMYVEPGKQIYGIRDLALEATEYVKKHDLVTVPKVAEAWRMYMITPKAQKTNPFFLGGPYIQVSYPTDTMSHEAKMMSMRGNSIPLSRSTVFHELIPGHHLQYHMIKRYKPHRRLFDTPFWMEGWALYWEFILWDKGFPNTPENRIGMLFWRMHRCCRIVFSLKFHLGQWSPQECIDYLVDKVGHERATAEGEVRRSFNGNYRPLYQAGYMLGALQLYALRREVVGTGMLTEREFHDRVLQENEMPIEVLRSLILELPVDLEFTPSWRFYQPSKG